MVGTSPAMTTVFWTTIVRQKHQRDHATRLSHRELCGGAILRGIFCVVLVMFLATSPAVAEVCDKVVGDHWRPSDGPVWTVVAGSWASISPVVLLLLFGIPAALASLPIALKIASERVSFVAAVYSKWLAYVAAVSAAFAAFFLLYDFVAGDDVMRVAASEGCISLRTNLAACGAVVLGVLVYGWTAWHMRRFARNAEARFRSLVPS